MYEENDERIGDRIQDEWMAIFFPNAHRGETSCTESGKKPELFLDAGNPS